MQLENIPVNGPLLQEKATKMALRLKTDKFKLSDGWLNRLKSYHGMPCKFVCGESGSVNEDTGTLEEIPA